MQELVVGNGTVITLGKQNRLIPRGAVAIRDGYVVEVGDIETFVGKYAGSHFIDARGGLIMPGFINAHTHLYSTFTRGLPFNGQAHNFEESLWSRLDRALHADDVRYGALLGLYEAIVKGTTTIFDHHVSSNHVTGSLDAIADGVLESGLRACLSYEVSDRDGKNIAKKGVDENKRFLERCKDEADRHSQRLAGAFGLHASFTLDDDTLASAAEVCQSRDASIHIHIAEDAVDVQESEEKYGRRPLERLLRADLLKRPAMLAHGVHLIDDEIRRIAETKSWILHTPQSNMSLAVGAAPVPKMLAHGVRVALGTDGLMADMLQEIRAFGLLRTAASADSRGLDVDQLYTTVFLTNARLAEHFFGKQIGILEPGAVGDLITIDYHPPTPFTEETFIAHLFFGIVNAPVRTTIVDGKVLMKDRQVQTLDGPKINARTLELAAKVWRRLE